MLFIGYLFANTFVFPLIEYKEWKYKIKEDQIELNYGVLIKTKTIIPISRIQYIDIEQGPIYRRFK
ncbi:MAG: PH domain-containing protein [Marinisporobacter sp.]|nr:PH domain-containing protein [Marinisporobacter sp.]